MSSKKTSHGYITGEQRAVLAACADKPGSFEALNTRACNALERRGLVEIEIDAVKLTATGKDALAEVGATPVKVAKPAPNTKPKVRGGIRRQPDGPAKARERDAAPAARRPMTAQALRELRALVVAEHALELASIDKTIEIAEALPSA